MITKPSLLYVVSVGSGNKFTAADAEDAVHLMNILERATPLEEDLSGPWLMRFVPAKNRQLFTLEVLQYASPFTVSTTQEERT